MAVAAFAIVLSAASSRAATPPRIVFSANRAPSAFGEIYRLEPNGRRIDLSRSPYLDTEPVVSPDGKRVAFLSNRSGSGKTAVYEVGIDGRGLVRVGPPSWNIESAAWQPHGRRLAFSANWVWIVRPGRKPVHVPGRIASAHPWSPDGRVLLTTAFGEIRAVSPNGHVLWRAPDVEPAPAAWSANGLAAFADGGGSITVYDESGHLRFKTNIGRSYAKLSWSPDGSRLVITWPTDWPIVREWTSTGRLVLTRHVRPNYEVAWAGQHRLIVVTHYPSRWLDPRSPDGKLAIVTSPPPQNHSGASFELGVAPARGGRVKPYARVPGCWGGNGWQAAVDSYSLQLAGRSIVYQTDCTEPPSDLYSISTNGSGPSKIPGIEPWATQPSVSPDGTRIAYVWASATGRNCAGCPSQIRVATADGTTVHVLTNPSDAWDLSPSWSPDGKTILFSEATADTVGAGDLYTVPAAGGAVQDLGVAGEDPAWGPSRIAYDLPAGGIWTANPDGSDPVQISTRGYLPAWSSDGRLAYLRGTYGRKLVVGTTTTLLPFASVKALAWSPDGNRLVLTASKTLVGPMDLYTVRPDGTDPVRLTKNYGVFGPGAP